MTGEDFNGHTGEGNRGKRKMLGRYVKEMNVEGWISEFCGKKMK